MTEETNQDFTRISRQKKLKDNKIVIGLRESEKLVGQIYPVLVDQDGNVLDGQHRLKADPNWHKRTVKVESERQAAMIRLHANWHRRRAYPEQVLDELAKATGWKGAAPYASFLGCNIRTVQRYLPQKYKLRKRIPKRQLSLSEKQSMTDHEIKRLDELQDQELKDIRDMPYETLGQRSRVFNKANLLQWLGNSLYNTVTLHTEQPEELLRVEKIREDCQLELEVLKTLEVTEDEILAYLRAYREKELALFKKIEERREREQTFKAKVDDLYSRFKQVTVEFTDGTKVPFIPELARSPGYFYDGNKTVRRDDKRYRELYIKRCILPVVTKQILGFDEHGYPLEGEA